MTAPDDTISERWRLFRLAREAGTPEAEAYDRYLHPRTRIPEAELAEAPPEATG